MSKRKKNKKISKNKDYAKKSYYVAIIAIIVSVVAIFATVIIALYGKDIEAYHLSDKRSSYMEQFNNMQFEKIVNCDGNKKFQKLLKDTDAVEYRDIHDYLYAMSLTKKGDYDGAVRSFLEIPKNSDLFPAAVYSMMQCELISSKNDDTEKEKSEIVDRFERLIKHCEKNNRQSYLENYMLKAIFYRFNMDYDGIKNTINEFKNSHYYRQLVGEVHAGVGEEFYLDDIHTIQTIYTALLITMRVSANANCIYDDVNWIDKELSKIKTIRRVENSMYFSCGGPAICDLYLVPNTLYVANKVYKLDISELEGEAESLVSSDPSIVDIKYKKYKFR